VAGRLSNIGKDLHSRLRGFFETPLAADAHPLEIFQAVLDDLERRVQPTGRGGRAFPYNRVAVRVTSATADRAAIDVVFRQLESRLRERLRELRCDPPAALNVQVDVLPQPEAHWAPGQLFSIDCDADPDPPRVESTQQAAHASLQITIVKGAAAQEVYTFTDALVCIGRTAEPADDLGRVRRNHVVFLDTVDGTTETVGRAHARVQRDGRTREYRIFHEGTSNATYIVRSGATIPVPPRDPRGVRIQSGDEVQLGRAVIRMEIA
jgi:hypothetical protein